MHSHAHPLAKHTLEFVRTDFLSLSPYGSNHLATPSKIHLCTLKWVHSHSLSFYQNTPIRISLSLFTHAFTSIAEPTHSQPHINTLTMHFINLHTHTIIHAYTHTCTHAPTHTHMHTCTLTHTHTRTLPHFQKTLVLSNRWKIKSFQILNKWNRGNANLWLHWQEGETGIIGVP